MGRDLGTFDHSFFEGSEPRLMRLSLQIVDRYIQDCLEQGVAPQVVDLARRLGISSWALTRRFERLHRCPPGRYMETVQLDRAKSLLRETMLPVEAIVSQCGFASARAFYRAFSRSTGTTPKAFRHGHSDAPLESPLVGVAGDVA